MERNGWGVGKDGEGIEPRSNIFIRSTNAPRWRQIKTRNFLCVLGKFLCYPQSSFALSPSTFKCSFPPQSRLNLRQSKQKYFLLLSSGNDFPSNIHNGRKYRKKTAIDDNWYLGATRGGLKSSRPRTHNVTERQFSFH